MSFRGEQKVKGKIYVYEATAVWNAQKQRSEQKRIYIGTKDPETGKTTYLRYDAEEKAFYDNGGYFADP